MRVPQYDTPQIEAAPLRAPAQPSAPSPELLASGAAQQANLAKGMMSAGAGATAIGMHIQSRENADMVFRAESSVREEYLAYEQEVRKSKQGRFAKDLTKDTHTWWNERIKTHTEKLGNPEQQRVFAQRTAALRQSSLHSVSLYEHAQLEKSHDEAWAADRNLVISQAVQTPTKENIAGAQKEIARLHAYQGARKGWDAAKVQNEVLQDTTQLHENILQGMAANDPAGAAEYFSRWKHEIDGRRHDEVGKFAKDVSANAIGDAAGQAIWKQLGPKTDSDPANLDDMESKAREVLKGNAPALRAAIFAIKEQTSAFDKGARERAAANAAEVSKAAMAGKSIREIQAMPAFVRLDGTKQAQMIEHIENSRYARALRSRQMKEQADADLGRANSAAYFTYSDPNVLKDMSRNQVLALLPSLGRQYTDHLIAKWDSLEKGGSKVIEARLDTEDFNHVAEGAGLRPFEKGMSEDRKAALGELKFRIENVIDGEQKAKKRVLTRAEKMDVFTREIDNRVLVDEWGRDPTKSMILLTTKERENAYVAVDGTRVDLKSIPAADRDAIVKGRQARGLPVTEQAIAQTWLRAQRGGTPTGGAAAPPDSSDVRFLKNVGRALAASVPSAASGVAGAARAGGDIVSTVTGPLSKARILPEDVGARIAKTFADMQKRQTALAAEWRPLPGRDYPSAAQREQIRRVLRQHGAPVSADAILEVYQRALEAQRKLQEWNPEP